MAVSGKPVALGLIGCGHFGAWCLSVFSKMPQVRVAAVADTVGDLAERLGRTYDVPAYDDPRALIAQEDVELVHIATPPSTHHPLAMAALDAGKHCLVEKPLAITTDQAEEIVAAAEGAGLIAPVNFVLRYNPVTEAVKRLIDSRLLGQVLSARLTNCATDTHLGEGHWFWDRDLSGGIFIEHGVHFFDLYSYWFGTGSVVSAHAEVREDGICQDRVTCLVRHDNGVLASHYHGFDQPALMDRQEHRLVCELGDIYVFGWIPLTIRVDAAVDDAAAEKLAALLPAARMQVLETFAPEQSRTRSRGKERRITKRVAIEHTPEPDKPTAYQAGARDLLADQLAYVRDPRHVRRITEANGRDAVALADAARRLAERGESGA